VARIAAGEHAPARLSISAGRVPADEGNSYRGRGTVLVRAFFSTALVLVAVTGIPRTAGAQEPRWALDFENGAVFGWYNDVRIPGSSGTLFSLTEDLASDTEYFWRVRLDVRLGARHVLSGLAAPLAIDAAGSFDSPVSFAGETFAPNVPVTGRYVFNSYRFTYRYEFADKGGWRFGLGVTAKVRDAVISLRTATRYAEKANLGVVPLVNFKIERNLGRKAVFRLEGDALAASQGRAEDIFAGLLVPLNRNVTLKAGYRMLEGGADNDEVYTFSGFHYAAVGAILRF
jgi:hypothetical protein